MHHAKAIAGVFNELARGDGKTLTHTQLNRLVYIAHGWCLGVLDRVLIRDAVYAMQAGPIIIAMHHFEQTSAVNGAAQLSVGSNHEPATDESALIEAVYDCYRTFSGYQLGLLTCAEDSPWARTWNDGRGENNTIPNSLIRGHYADIASARAGIPVLA